MTKFPDKLTPYIDHMVDLNLIYSGIGKSQQAKLKKMIQLIVSEAIREHDKNAQGNN